jgi:hypothetical protein
MLSFPPDHNEVVGFLFLGTPPEPNEITPLGAYPQMQRYHLHLDFGLLRSCLNRKPTRLYSHTSRSYFAPIKDTLAGTDYSTRPIL